ncbi:MAG: AAA family ATPase [Methanothrix soehngenii]|jgi:putative ATP-dependent endonuclease of OLD family|uniref:ATP-dependent nuclease n=1 Tax=Methanothrix soehngenii TaxID=2223 RepID=UPI003140E4A8
MGIKSGSSGIKISEVRIHNFRSLQNICVDLEWLTILIGENNSGKTSFLDALYAAIGAGRRTVSVEDIFLSPGDRRVPRDRAAVIDIIIRPTDIDGKIIETFPAGSYWLALWGEGVSQDEFENEFAGIRTLIKWDPTKGEYMTSRNFLKDYKSAHDDWINAEIKMAISFAQIEPIGLYLLDAKRDMKDELQNRNSFWYKLISDLDLDDETIERFETVMTNLNEDIISDSPVLSHVQYHLDELYKTIGGNRGSVAITPVPRHLRDLSNGMDVGYATKDAQMFPLSRHGMGTRSLAAVLTFRAYTTWRQAHSNRDRVHTMLALEEPESHLHPQAQRALFVQIEAIPGQRIISTHSPIIASQGGILQLRHFCKDGACTKVTRISSSIAEDDALKIERMVLNTRGDLLFARIIVLFEGEQTEDQALPVFAEKFWHIHPNALGITMIPVGGLDYLPFLTLASDLQIPWYIFSDGEQNAVNTVNKCLKKLSIPLNTNRLIKIPDGKNFETYIANGVYKDTLIGMIIEAKAKNKRHEEALKKEWKLKTIEDVILELKNEKTKYGKLIAEAITNMQNAELRFPPPIKKLFEEISNELGPIDYEANGP